MVNRSLVKSSSRREFLTVAAALGAAAALPKLARAEELPPVRTITRGPKYHWFGYYDKLQFDPTNRYVLSNQVAFEHRTPRADDVIQVGMVDTQDEDRWIEFGESRAWCWQQGCMLQWRPKSADEVLWNDREGDRFVCRLYNFKTHKRRTIPSPVYTVSPDGRFGLTADFARIQIMRPGYGTSGCPTGTAMNLRRRIRGFFASICRRVARRSSSRWRKSPSCRTTGRGWTMSGTISTTC